MSQGNGSLGGGDVENRVVSVAYPLTLEEFWMYYEQGYQVAATPEQRAEWGLDPVETLPVLSHEQALRVLFAEPGDPILDELDDECHVDEHWALGEGNAPDADGIGSLVAARERRLGVSLTVRDPLRSPAAGPAGSDDPSREVAAASA